MWFFKKENQKIFDNFVHLKGLNSKERSKFAWTLNDTRIEKIISAQIWTPIFFFFLKF